MKNRTTYTEMLLAVACGLSLCLTSPLSASEGTAQGEHTDELGQQGVGLEDTAREQGSSGPAYSNVIMGGPDIVVGRITHIDGDWYSVSGDRGQEISLRVTKDTNLVCVEGPETRFTTGRENPREQYEIAPTPFMERQTGNVRHEDNPALAGGHEGQQRVISEQEMNQQIQQDMNPEEPGALTKDPAMLLDKVGSTDPKANEDVAKGSGFVVGGKEGCGFRVGDEVRIEASDIGTATTLRQLARAEDDLDTVAERMN